MSDNRTNEKRLTDDEIIADAMKRHPDCSFGQVANGMNCMFQVTRVVQLWRNEGRYLAGDKPWYEVEGYSR